MLWTVNGLAVAAVCGAIALGTTSVQAQEPEGVRLRIGYILPPIPEDPAQALQAEVIRNAEQGALLAREETAFNAELFGFDFGVEIVHAVPADIWAVADRMLEEQDIAVLVGGLRIEDATMLGWWAQGKGVTFLNIAAPDDALRNESCFSTTYHIGPSAAMYLDALAGWYVRAGFRRWYFVQADTAPDANTYRRAQWSIEERHFGVRRAGHSVIKPGEGLGSALRDVTRSNADFIVLLMPAEDQLLVLAELEKAGVTAQVTGFPYPETQTREFMVASREAAPRLGTGHRALSWEATLDAYGAREINSRYMQRFGEPMDGAAWGAYMGIKTAFESTMFGGAADGAAILEYFAAPTTVFDVWKGIGTSFRPWDRQLRQPLYLAKIEQTSSDMRGAALLVGELPAIYMPGTDPVERLDQLGDLARQSRCRR